jgi:hypothetical protein
MDLLKLRALAITLLEYLDLYLLNSLNPSSKISLLSKPSSPRLFLRSDSQWLTLQLI